MPSNFLRSIILAAVLGFLAPTLLVSGSLAGTWLLAYIPSIGQTPISMLLDFLGAFGSGCAFQGILTIGLVCGFVGCLFDIYTFYSFQAPKSN